MVAPQSGAIFFGRQVDHRLAVWVFNDQYIGHLYKMTNLTDI
jgi:hypothetical protein